MRLSKFCKNLCTASKNTCRCNIGFEHYCEIPIEQRENRLKDSLGKFITLLKARAVYLGGRSRNKTLPRFSSWKFSMY